LPEPTVASGSPSKFRHSRPLERKPMYWPAVMVRRLTQASRVKLVAVGSVPSETLRYAGVSPAPPLARSTAGPTLPAAPFVTMPLPAAANAFFVESVWSPDSWRWKTSR
jgi:hypothetical protein